ncbi:MAG: histidine phosphatase family protein [Planctomycetota bacterium]
MARFVYIARHAWAGQFGDPGYSDDSLRELEDEGAERYARVVQTLAERGFAPDLVATSPFTRCLQTAQLIARHTMHSPEVVTLESLVPGSDIQSLMDWTRKSNCEQVCWVGHAPDVTTMTAALVANGGANIRFAKGAIAAVRVDGPVDYGAGELYWHLTAKSLGL